MNLSRKNIARIQDIILDERHPRYKSPDSIGNIIFTPIDEPTPINNTQLPVAKPLYKNIAHYPVANEIVYIVSAPGSRYNETGKLINYYLHPHSIFKDPNHNSLPNALNYDNKFYQGEYFIENETIRPLKPYEGDIIIEGRFGNSIRFGSTVDNSKVTKKNPWSWTGTVGNPITVIRNGQRRNIAASNFQHIVEDINKDDSSIYLCSNQQLTKFIPASLHSNSYGHQIFEQTKYQEPTIPNTTASNSIVEDIDLTTADYIPASELQELEELNNLQNTDVAYYDIAETEPQIIQTRDSITFPSTYNIPATTTSNDLKQDITANTSWTGTTEVFNRAHNIWSPRAFANSIDNYPGVDGTTNINLTEEKIWTNLQLLHLNCVNPILEAFGHDSIRICSAYRSIELNKAIKGNSNSQHLYGYAIDLISTKHPTSLLWNFCYQNLPSFNQLIWEFPERGNFITVTKPFSWIHISYIQNNNPKTSSISSKRPDLHEMYLSEKSTRIGNYTHGIVYADDNLI